MNNKLFQGLEQLETEKVQDLTEQANKSGEFEILYDNLKKLQDVQENKESEDDTEPSEDNPEEGSDSEPPTEEEPTEEEQAAVESFNNLSFALESFGDSGAEVSDKGLFARVGSSLAAIGVEYGPKLLKALYKGVILTLSHLVKALFVGANYLAKYIERRNKAFSRLKESLTSMEKALAQAKNFESLEGQKFHNASVINSLKIGKNVDFTRNVSILSKFVSTVIVDMNKQISKEAALVQRLIAISGSKLAKTPEELMVVSPFLNGFHEGALSGYKHDPEKTASYVSQATLPSDIKMLAFLPRPDLSESHDIASAYSNSKIFLGVDMTSFQEVANVDYMTSEQLGHFVRELKTLCDLCIQHEKMYTDIANSKKHMKFGFKNYVARLIDSDRKVTVKESLVQYVYLKSLFIDKVYLMGSVDVHDYCAKTISYGLSFVEAHVKKLS